MSGVVRPRRSAAADAVAVLGVVLVVGAAIELSHGAVAPFSVRHAPSTVSTDPALLPSDAARSLLRMFAALAASTVFTFVYATAAARSRRAGMILIPLLDVLQSVPVLGLLSVTLTGWLSLFPDSTLGLECASVFAIFTSQVWSMTFAFHQSLVTQPRDLDDAARVMRITRWQRFWKLDVPAGVFPLVWNGMMSFGGGWFFLVASEAISVDGHRYALPGIGSYIAAASDRGDIGKMLLAIGGMVVMVVGVNVVFWRPVTAWAERFRHGDTAGVDAQRSMVFDPLRHSHLPSAAAAVPRPAGTVLLTVSRPFGVTSRVRRDRPARRRPGDVAFGMVVAAAVVAGAIAMAGYLGGTVGLGEVGVASADGLLTFGRVAVLLIAATIVWVPVGVWIGMSPRVSRVAQPIVQVLASFPANVLFPLAAAALIGTGVSLDGGGILLMSLGAQWYILVNVIAGASAIPNDLREASRSLLLPRVLRWRTLILPAIFPSYLTGGITAAGGAWNVSIVSEVVSFHRTTLHASGLGSYIADATSRGDFPRTLVGVGVMSAFVVGFNRLFWRRLHLLAEHRLRV